VYAATEAASTIGAPVYVEQDRIPSASIWYCSMKLHERGFLGKSAGDKTSFHRLEQDRCLTVFVAAGKRSISGALESSGSGSSIWNRAGASTGAGEGMTVSAPPGAVAASGHVDGGSLRAPKGITVAGNFARFREVGGFDSQKNVAVVALQAVGNLAGVAANKSKVVEMEVDLDGPTTSRMVLSGLATFNQALTEQFKAGQQASGG
jgi:hypothetical protein